MTPSSYTWKSLVGISTVSFLGGICLLKIKQHLASNTASGNALQKWVKVGTVKKLIVYPVKSCKGVEVETAQITELGLAGKWWIRLTIIFAEV